MFFIPGGSGLTEIFFDSDIQSPVIVDNSQCRFQEMAKFLCNLENISGADIEYANIEISAFKTEDRLVLTGRSGSDVRQTCVSISDIRDIQGAYLVYLYFLRHPENMADWLQTRLCATNFERDMPLNRENLHPCNILKGSLKNNRFTQIDRHDVETSSEYSNLLNAIAIMEQTLFPVQDNVVWRHEQVQHDFKRIAESFHDINESPTNVDEDFFYRLTNGDYSHIRIFRTALTKGHSCSAVINLTYRLLPDAQRILGADLKGISSGTNRALMSMDNRGIPA